MLGLKWKVEEYIKLPLLQYSNKYCICLTSFFIMGSLIPLQVTLIEKMKCENINYDSMPLYHLVNKSSQLSICLHNICLYFCLYICMIFSMPVFPCVQYVCLVCVMCVCLYLCLYILYNRRLYYMCNVCLFVFLSAYFVQCLSQLPNGLEM